MKKLIIALVVLVILAVIPCLAFGDSAEDWNNKGRQLAKPGKYEEAIDAYTRAIELDPKFAGAYNNRANNYFRLGKYEQAIIDYTKTIELQPKLSISYANRGRCYEKLGKSQKAINDYKTAAKMGFEPAQDYLKEKGIQW